MKGQLWLLLICFPVNFSATGWHSTEADKDSLKDSLRWVGTRGRNLRMGMVISTWGVIMYPTTIATSTWSSTKLSLKKRSLPMLIPIFPVLSWKTSRILHFPWYSEQPLCHSFFSPLLTTENLFKIIWKKLVTWKQPPSFLLCQRKLDSNNITSGIRLGQVPALASHQIKPHNFIWKLHI